MGNMMEFRLLGPVEVFANGVLVPLSARQKVVLAVLLAECGKVVSVERMVDALWPEDPPATARSQIQITISALRRLMSGDIILTRAPGYLIDVPGDAVDINRFEVFVADAAAVAEEGRIGDAVLLLRKALTLWSGSALEGLPGDATSVLAARINERCVSVLCNYAKLELQLGRHAELAGELRGYVAGNPFNEELRGLLALALYRSGRQADALRVLYEGRELLAEEMGLEPGAELRRLEYAILTADRSLDLPQEPQESGAADREPAWVPRQLPRTSPGFVGRDELISMISRLLVPERATAIEVPLAVLTGRGGMGKTALAVRVAHLVSQDFPDGQIFLQFHSDSRRDPEDMLVRLLRLAGCHPDSIPSDPEGRAGLFRSWLADRRVLIVLDSVVSLSQVTPFLPGTSSCAVIVTSQRRLGALEGAVHFEVGPMDEPAAFDLIARLVGRRRVRSEASAVTDLIKLCDSMPLALCAVGAKLAARPHWQISRMTAQLRDRRRRFAELELSGVSVRSTIALSCRWLEASPRTLLRRLSLLNSGDFPSWIAAPLLDTDVQSAEDVLQQLVDAHVVESLICEGKHVRFCLHDLVRIYAQECAADEETDDDRANTIKRVLEAWLSLARAARRYRDGISAGLSQQWQNIWSLPPDVMRWVIGDGSEWLRAEHSSLLSAAALAARYGFDELSADIKAVADL